MKRLIAIALIASTAAQPALAQWIQRSKEDPFEGKNLLGAFTASGSYGFGIRCEVKSKTLELVFITPEKIDKGTVDAMNLTSPKLLVIVDNDAVVEEPATFFLADDESVLAVSHDPSIKALGTRIASAHKRIAVALDLAGQKLHKSEFGIFGLKKATASVLSSCAGG